jgi:hypothetical protein
VKACLRLVALTALPALALAGAIAGCAPASPAVSATAADGAFPTPAEGAGRPIADLHAHRCGACHTLPAPGTRSRAHLEDAVVRHRKRLRLTAEQWHAMVDYLAAQRE